MNEHFKSFVDRISAPDVSNEMLMRIVKELYKWGLTDAKEASGKAVSKLKDELRELA